MDNNQTQMVGTAVWLNATTLALLDYLANQQGRSRPQTVRSLCDEALGRREIRVEDVLRSRAKEAN